MAQAKKDLVIVESPAKARTIEKYLGGDYKVIASMGHLRDLPKSKLGVDIEHGFTPEYIPVAARSDVINELKKRSKEAGTVYLATDPDREGEAISWHLKELLKIPDEKARRVTFNEITKKVVQESIANPRDIDQDLVDAQQARRILDRIVGYKLSPLLWRKVRRGLSAGRVQSVAVRMVDDREKEIQAFEAQEYWTLDADLTDEATHKTFEAHYYGKDGKKVEPASGEQVDGIIAEVRARGDEALKEYALKFDGAKIDDLQVTQAEIDEAFANMDPYFLETLREAAANIESFHRQQVHKNFVINEKPGIVLGQKYTPIEKAGVYVPGGTAAYPSTVLMDVIPAKVAGVSEIVMTTPAGKDGRVNPVILAAAATAGVTKIFKTGGAQAVAALAYGTQSIPAVDKIVGPGNIYVATAKRKVFGKVGIDMIAGPSEILVLADGGCNPAWVAADLLSQAEHDKLASPVLVTDSPALARAVQAELEVQIPQLPRAAIARASVDDNGKIIVCTDLHKAIEACNIIAPEHLEVCVEDPFGVLNEIKNAGSIFLGRNVPEALGDYFAGPNHTLPTSGTARFSSPLGVDDFVKKSSFLYYTREALGEVAPRIADFAEREGLHAHAKSVTIRYEED